MQNEGSKATRIERLVIDNREKEIVDKLRFYQELIQDITNKEVSAIYYDNKHYDLIVRFDNYSVALRAAGIDARELTKNIIIHFSDYKNKEIAEELRKSLQRALRENHFYSRLDVDECK